MAIYLTVTYFVLLVEVSFSTLCLLLIAPQNRKLEGMRSMVTAFLLLLTSSILYVSASRHVPQFFPYVLGNWCLMLGLTMLHFSFPEVRARSRVQRRISVYFFIVLFVTTLWFTYGYDSHAWRVFFVSLALGGQACCTAIILFRFAEPAVRYPTRCTSAMFGLMGGIQIWRAVWIAIHHVAPDEVGHSPLRWMVLLGYAVLAATIPLLYFWTMTVRLQGKLERLAFTDSLTGLLNRRGIEQEIAVELSRLVRNSEAAPLSVILFDLDYFKQINDQYGHEAGDLVLEKLSGELPSVLRGFDRLARMGGEEFLIVLPQTSAEQARLIAERLRLLIETTVFDFQGEALTVTASLGVATTSSAEEAWHSLIGRADKNVYKAKDLGRNCVVA